MANFSIMTLQFLKYKEPGLGNTLVDQLKVEKLMTRRGMP